MKNRTSVSHEEIQSALAKFRKAGGLITRLPNELSPPRKLVGEKWAAYESLLEIVAADLGLDSLPGNKI